MKSFPRLRRYLIILASVVVAYALIGFLVVPPIARAQFEKRASAALHRPVKVAKVRCNPFAASVAVEGLQVTDHDGAEFASWARAYVNFDPLMSLFRWQWRIGEVRLTQPRQRVLIGQNGALNLADLFVPTPKTEAESVNTEETRLPSVGIDLLHVEDWSVDFTDQSRRSPFHTVVGPMAFELRDFSTQPDTAGPYSFAGTSETIERFAWSGTISAEPPGSKGRIEIQNVSLPAHMPFVEERFGGEIKQGRVSLTVSYDIAAGKSPVLRLTEMAVVIDDLGVGLRGAADTPVTWKKLEVHVANADLLARTANVTRVALTGFDAHVQRLAGGALDLLALLPAPASAGDPPHAPADDGPAASIRIDEIALIDGRVRVTDQTTPRPGAIILDQINVTATNAGTDLDREIKLEAKARWTGSGSVSATGRLRVRPLAAALEVQGSGLSLRPLDPWLEPAINVRIASGVQQFQGHLDVTQEPAGRLALTWTGDTGIDDLVIHDGASGGKLLGWESLSSANMRFTLDPLEFSVGEIKLVAPHAHIAIDEHGVLNLTSIRSAPTAPPETSTPTKENSGPASVATPGESLAAVTRQSLPLAAKIDAITITGGRFSLHDRSVPGGFATELRDFGGSIRGLSSAELARAEVDLSGSLDGVAPLRIKGSINPLADDRFSNVTVTFSNIDLPLFTLYGGKFLGKQIQQGKLSVDFVCRLSQSLLEVENHVLLDQFFLGESVASPGALKLPIGLALALLRDREGRIRLEVPVRGNLDDPDFKYGRVVLQVIGNVITKAATAPFALLGGLFGGKPEDLSSVDFASGSAALSEAVSEKLQVLARSLYERPALRLTISAPPAPDGDRPGLREQRLLALLRAERRTLGTTASTDDAVSPLTPEETEILVRSLFARQFPTEAAAAAAATGTLPPPAQATGESRQRGLLERIVGSIFRRSEKPPPPPAVPATPGPATTPSPEAAAPLTLVEMQARLLESITLSDADFQEVANRRARAIRDRLLAGGKIEPERVFLVTEPKVPEGANNAIAGGRVFFGLE